MENQIFDWLMAHGTKTLTGNEWGNLLNVSVIDADGWDNDTIFHLTPISLTDFITRVASSTIC